MRNKSYAIPRIPGRRGRPPKADKDEGQQWPGPRDGSAFSPLLPRKPRGRPPGSGKKQQISCGIAKKDSRESTEQGDGRFSLLTSRCLGNLVPDSKHVARALSNGSEPVINRQLENNQKAILLAGRACRSSVADWSVKAESRSKKSLSVSLSESSSVAHNKRPKMIPQFAPNEASSFQVMESQSINIAPRTSQPSTVGARISTSASIITVPKTPKVKALQPLIAGLEIPPPPAATVHKTLPPEDRISHTPVTSVSKVVTGSAAKSSTQGKKTSFKAILAQVASPNVTASKLLSMDTLGPSAKDIAENSSTVYTVSDESDSQVTTSCSPSPSKRLKITKTSLSKKVAASKALREHAGTESSDQSQAANRAEKSPGKRVKNKEKKKGRGPRYIDSIDISNMKVEYIGLEEARKRALMAAELPFHRIGSKIVKLGNDGLSLVSI